MDLKKFKDGNHSIKVLAKTDNKEKIIGKTKFVLNRSLKLKENSKQSIYPIILEIKEKLEKISPKVKDDLKMDIEEIIDELYLRYGGDQEAVVNCPPYSIRKTVGAVGSIWAYSHVSSEYTAYLKTLCNLQSHHKVLEIGCGCGRIATSLQNYIQKPGGFYGLDVVPELINYAKSSIKNPVFHFTNMNIYSHMYNPDPNALKPENVKFPYNDNFFDVVFLISVFTHMLPQSVENYVKEISRVIKTNGKCLLSVFLFQNNQKFLKTNWF